MHSEIGEHLGYFHFLATVNNTIILNICVQGIVWMYALISPGYRSRSEIAGLHDNTVFYFLEEQWQFWKFPSWL